MMSSPQDKITVELHLHTQASKDSLMSPERLIAHCDRIGLDRFAVTDHNKIEGAFRARDLAPTRVIVGEEIRTTKGELMGYFMSEWIPPDLPPMEVIARLKAQNAFISVAHPFDTVRSQHWALDDLLAVAPHVDAIETFNARCLHDVPNKTAQAFARAHGLLETVGSDAHSLFEVGRAYLSLPAFEGPESFRQALKHAQPLCRRSPFFVHFFSRYASLRKRVTKLTNKVFPKHRS